MTINFFALGADRICIAQTLSIPLEEVISKKDKKTKELGQSKTKESKLLQNPILFDRYPIDYHDKNKKKMERSIFLYYGTSHVPRPYHSQIP